VIRFTKMHGLGNDYLFLDAFRDPALARRDDFERLAIEMSERRHGAGADGLILLAPDTEADAAMRIWNADGSDGVICGNGLRCAARLLVERGHVGDSTLRIRTGAGVRAAHVFSGVSGFESVEVDMGAPATDLSSLPVRLDKVQRVGDGPTLEVGGRRGLFVGAGNPHFVIVIEDGLEEVQLEAEGPALERHPAFPERMNIQFVQVESPSRLRVRTWERGSGATAACGTGACAGVVGAHLLGLVERSATVALPGGDLEIRWDETTGRVLQRGPAAYVFEGRWPEDGEPL